VKSYVSPYRPQPVPLGLAAGVRGGLIIAAAGDILRKGSQWTADQVRVANVRLGWRLTDAELERAAEIARVWRGVKQEEALMRQRGGRL